MRSSPSSESSLSAVRASCTSLRRSARLDRGKKSARESRRSCVDTDADRSTGPSDYAIADPRGRESHQAQTTSATSDTPVSTGPPSPPPSSSWRASAVTSTAHEGRRPAPRSCGAPPPPSPECASDIASQWTINNEPPRAKPKPRLRCGAWVDLARFLHEGANRRFRGAISLLSQSFRDVVQTLPARAVMSPLPPATSSQTLQQRLRAPAPRASSRPLRATAFAREIPDRTTRHLLGLESRDSDIPQQAVVQAEQLLPFAAAEDKQPHVSPQPLGCRDQPVRAPGPGSSAHDDSLSR